MDLRSKAYHTRRRVLEFFEDQWFDRTRRVRTAGDVSLSLAGISAGDAPDSEFYMPARPRHVRDALREVPVTGFAGYSYVDLGSGKGRTLFVAAEFPFEHVVGVELSERLHRIAVKNVASFRYGGRRAATIRPVQQNAAGFKFPTTPLVVYMFNPFGAATMQRVLDNLAASLEEQPRHAVVVLLWPRCGDLVARSAGMQQVCQSPHHQIFQAHAELAPA